MDNIAPPSPPVTPPAGPKQAPKPKPVGGAIQTPKHIAANLDQLKQEFAANPPPIPAATAKPKGRPKKAAAPKPQPQPQPPVVVKQEPIERRKPETPVERIDLTTTSSSDSDSDSDSILSAAGSPRASPDGYEPPSEGPSTMTKGLLILGAFAGAFLLGQHLVKSSVPSDAHLPAPTAEPRSQRRAAADLADSDRHESATGPISKADIQAATRRKPLSEAALKNAGTASQ